MRQSKNNNASQISNNREPSPPPSYNKMFSASQPSKPRPLRSMGSQNANTGDFVKPELPEFLQNMGPGISPLKESQPITVSWHNVWAQAPSKQNALMRKINGCLGREVSQPKDLLKGVSGIVKPGELCGIMGASGAGKTTLLNIITHRRSGKLKIDADVRINGRKMKKDISGISAFVQQEELFIGSLTVREHLRFHAMLRLGKEFTKDERENRVDEVIQFLNLGKAENTTIGITGIVKGLSGGEKRRLTFATEILSDPPLLFCDEPTSGLDSSMAFIVVQAMRKLADQGKTIICTIHQPSSEIFFLFDRLYLLAEGRVGYFGSLEKAPAFFRQFGLEIPRNYNPADFYIKQLAIYPKTREENLVQIKRICDGYEKSPQNSRYMSEILALHSENPEDDDNIPCSKLINRCCRKGDTDDVDVQNQRKSRYKTNSFTQLRWLIWRNFVDIFKNPFEIRLRIILAIFLGVLIGLLYIQLKYDQTAVQNFNSLIFLIIINTSFSNIFAVVQSYTKEYPIFYKDYDDAVYRVAPYYFAKFVTELPLFAITTLIQVAITYWMTNLYTTAKRFFIFTGIIILTSFASVGLGSVLSVIADSPEQAAALQIPILLPLMVFGGFFLNNQSGQKWLTWIKYISWFYYGNEALIINQWTDVKTLPCTNLDSGSPCIHNGDEVLQLLGFSKSHLGRDIGLIIAIWIGLRALSFFLLLLKARKHKYVKTTTTDNTYESSQQTSTINTEISTVTREKQQVLHANTLETPIEWEQILDREFQSIDIDADGYISVSDMQSVLKNFSHIYNSNELILRIFEELDLNHDQRISKQEFKSYKNILLDREKRFHRSTFEEKFDSIFILFDRNQDNYISRHEIRETMHNLGEYIDDNLLEEMMQTADINHDDRISREEFKKLLLQLYSNKTK
ncbi:unnamed protein product [Adineta steineri]|uniref:Uncharacterized protein n=1 Tax=Adineta steineri TaxID=433720 RepID=A0A813MI96_9BILA|nr:unnamed protein product [Adineta steineri]CAF0833059.1 unnamed protein product [Adineta steineri]